MLQHTQLSDFSLKSKIHSREIRFAGNKKLKIYGLLRCTSGKRMKKENRVFFGSAEEAVQNNYRPCGNCMKKEYNIWKKQHTDKV
ncbi:metal-binding protein [Chryseobacterium flavum]|uniref:Metal-binding protein n=1 Tax=Chryseobacterium flavum TaxID=415851 RepID=A0A3D9CJE9_9FLAO|nr:Ada metal-binding domain-containing protein [Chryseobacterium flavum]REC65855.1 metal-binding protein [Chryseobacterium flavum]